MLIVLFFVLSRGRKKEKVVKEPVLAEATPVVTPIGTMPAGAPAIPGRPNKAFTAAAQPIAEDPQKAYIREQIQALGKTNPATVAQLIQTWMDEDRRN
jgi:flagellar biosynthesis/type III secretory pathway M-ring protein FliF/YscJ